MSSQITRLATKLIETSKIYKNRSLRLFIQRKAAYVSRL